MLALYSLVPPCVCHVSPLKLLLTLLIVTTACMVKSNLDNIFTECYLCEAELQTANKLKQRACSLILNLAVFLCPRQLRKSFQVAYSFAVQISNNMSLLSMASWEACWDSANVCLQFQCDCFYMQLAVCCKTFRSDSRE